mmetsp:Transcript_27482/g.20641  ORF Transcript_27482/g.20641 Transcript_27482/m.20641 type:complete len:84 (+) Transcript_27482:253-504(+)
MKYDNINKLVRQKEAELEEVKKKLDLANEDELNVEDENFRKTNYLKTTDEELEIIKEEQEFEMMFQRSYLHMLDRMKKDLIAA